MKLFLKRKECNSWGIISELRAESGEIICVALEHAYPFGHFFHPKLNLGLHDCFLGSHFLPKMGPLKTYEVRGVLGHTGILFHPGNFNHESDGCVLLGMDVSSNHQMISRSMEGFQRFMDHCQETPRFVLEVVE